MVSLSAEFSVANREREPYTLKMRRAAVFSAGIAALVARRKLKTQRDLRRNANVPDAAHLTASNEFSVPYGPSGAPLVAAT